LPEENRLYPSRGTRPISPFTLVFVCAFSLFVPGPAMGRAWSQWDGPALYWTGSPSPGLLAQEAKLSKHDSIPPGAILPVILRTTISPHKASRGQIIHAVIAQDVPLPDGSKVSRGSKVEGRVVEVIPAGKGAGARISIRFDKLYFQGRTILITTNLRAIAGFMAVLEAGIPNQGMGEGDVASWMTTTQVGGDSVFGVWGPVTSAHDATHVVGKSVGDGVLAQVQSNERANCRGVLNGNNSPQALWVFSSDACGTYGLANVSISHAGRTDPAGTIILEFQAKNAIIHSGAGLLLRLIG